MKLILWNILDGGAARTPGICRWIADQKPQLAALCECNGWTDPAVRQTALRLSGANFCHVLDPGPSAYRPGLLSWTTLTPIPTHTDPMWHGLLHARCTFAGQPLNLLVSHWSPTDPDCRRREAQICLDLIRTLTGPTLLTGDLNSHSPTDHPAIQLQRIGAWAADYRPHCTLLDGGLIDLAADQPQRHTVATALKPDEPRRRLDFVYANAAFVDLWPAVRSRVCHDPAVASLSDHWPVIVQ